MCLGFHGCMLLVVMLLCGAAGCLCVLAAYFVCFVSTFRVQSYSAVLGWAGGVLGCRVLFLKVPAGLAV